MRVLHVLNTGGYSGAEKVAITIIQELKQKYDVNCYYCSPDGMIKDVLEELDIDFFPVDKVNAKNLRRVIKKIRPEIIHAHDFMAGVVSALATPRNIKIISHIHNNSPWIRNYCPKSFIYLASTLRYSNILTVSDSVASEYVFGDLLKKKIKTIGNPVDTDKIVKMSEEELPDEVGSIKKIELAEYSPDIIFIGRFSSPKNPFFLVELIKAMVEKKKDISVAMIGQGELQDEVKESLYTEISSGCVRMFGFVQNPYPILARSKVLLLPSKWEGYGLVAVEALSLGVPVVCSGVGGLKDIVDDSCGRIINREDKETYVNELLKMITDSEYQNKKAIQARRRASEINNIEDYINTIYKSYKRIYDEVY